MDLSLSLLNEIYVNLDLRFQTAYDNAKPWSDEVATTVPSGTRENKYGWLGKIPRMRKWVGERVLNNLAAREYAIVNDDFEVTIEIDRNDIEDEQMALYSTGIDEIGYQSKKWPDDMVLGLMTAGDSLTPVLNTVGQMVNPIGFDGLPFYSGNHPVDLNNPSSPSQSNLFNSTTSGALPLNYANWAFARGQGIGFKGEDARPMGLIPDRLVVPPALELTAYQISNGQIIASAVGANVAQAQSNVVPMLQGAVRPLMIPELAGQDDTWYGICTSRPLKPFIKQIRKQPQLVPRDSVTYDNVFWHKKFVYGADARGAAGYSLWFLSFKAGNH